jgi:hypothetical protein
LVAPDKVLKGLPTKKLDSRSISVSWDKVLMAFGIKPCKLLSRKVISRMEDNAPISGGILPMRLFSTGVVKERKGKLVILLVTSK